MDILSDNIVVTRKPHICNACHRKFDAGTKMRTCFIVDGGDNWTWRECPTCQELLSKHSSHFDDGDGVFWMNCVYESLDRGQTPEDLLASLNIA